MTLNKRKRLLSYYYQKPIKVRFGDFFFFLKSEQNWGGGGERKDFFLITTEDKQEPACCSTIKKCGNVLIEEFEMDKNQK